MSPPASLVAAPSARIVLVTAPAADALTLARKLVDEWAKLCCAGLKSRSRLAACVQLSEIRSVYFWQGKVEDEPETRLTIKTWADRLPALHDAIRAAHPYNTPQMLVVNGTSDYVDWLQASTRPS